MEIIATGFVNRGEEGGHRAVTSFPSLTRVDDGRLLAVYRVGSVKDYGLGPTKDSDDQVTELRWSDDLGRTWSEPVSPFSTIVDGVRGTPQVCCVTDLGRGHLIAATQWVDREAYPGQRLFNPENNGILPTSILLADSRDSGRTWGPQRVVPAPLTSLTNPILRFADGTLALSLETNIGYEEAGPWHLRVVYLYSRDRGETWSAPVTVAEDPAHRVFYWDQRAGVAPDGTLVTFSWTYEGETNTYRNVQRNLSTDQGRSWRGFEDLGFTDQPSRPAILPDGRVVVAWVDRFETASIRARSSARPDAPFPKKTEVVLYEHEREERLAADATKLVRQIVHWSYGLPFAETLPNGEVMVVYYAGTETCMDCRWARLRV
jgi:hypothetical protein